jgi:hypothetical protein
MLGHVVIAVMQQIKLGGVFHGMGNMQQLPDLGVQRVVLGIGTRTTASSFAEV